MFESINRITEQASLKVRLIHYDIEILTEDTTRVMAEWKRIWQNVILCIRQCFRCNTLAIWCQPLDSSVVRRMMLGQDSMMWDIVWTLPYWHRSQATKPHLVANGTMALSHPEMIQCELLYLRAVKTWRMKNRVCHQMVIDQRKPNSSCLITGRCP